MNKQMIELLKQFENLTKDEQKEILGKIKEDCYEKNNRMVISNN